MATSSGSLVSGSVCNVRLYPFLPPGVSSPATWYDLPALEVRTVNTIRGEPSFAIVLPPGGPAGTTDPIEWKDRAPLMSSVVIYMARGGNTTMMIGVVTNTAWTLDRTRPGTPPMRLNIIEGTDFSYFFNTQNLYNLAAQFGFASAALGSLGPYLTAAGEGVLGGVSPASAARQWYDLVMTGSSGLLQITRIPATGDTFPNTMSTWFQEYNGPIQIPYGASFLSDGSTWMEKFRLFLPGPWYETFTVTAAQGFYGAASTPDAAVTFKNLTAYPTFVARQNPLPSLGYMGEDLTLDVRLWNDLKGTYSFGPTQDGEGPLFASVGRRAADVSNFFLYQPTALLASLGASNQNFLPIPYFGNSWIDTNSIKTYGYRPVILTTQWFSDFSGVSGKQNYSQASDFRQLVNQVALRLVSYYGPLGLMESGNIRMELRPDIQPGCVYQGALYQGETSKTFYIEGVENEWRFGQGAFTTLHVSRGLPTYIYENPSSLLAVLRGQAYLSDGSIKIDTSMPGVTLASQARANEIMNATSLGRTSGNPA